MSYTTVFVILMTMIVMLSISMHWASSRVARRYAVLIRNRKTSGRQLRSRDKIEQAFADMIFNLSQVLIAIIGMAWIAMTGLINTPTAMHNDYLLTVILLACAAMAACYTYIAWRAYQNWRD